MEEKEHKGRIYAKKVQEVQMCGKERGVSEGEDQKRGEQKMQFLPCHMTNKSYVVSAVQGILSFLSLSMYECLPSLLALQAASTMVTMDMLGNTMRVPSSSGRLLK